MDNWTLSTDPRLRAYTFRKDMAKVRLAGHMQLFNLFLRPLDLLSPEKRYRFHLNTPSKMTKYANIV